MPYLPYDDQHTNVFHLNEALVTKAYELTKNLPLSDSAEAASRMLTAAEPLLCPLDAGSCSWGCVCGVVCW
jgi:purine nucleoside permease